MTQKLFNRLIGILFLIKALTVGYYWLNGITVAAFFGVVSDWVMAIVVIFSVGFAYLAFTIENNKKYIRQKLFNQIFGTLSGIDALVSLYYLLFNVKIILGNQTFPDWLMIIVAILDLYLFYTAFNLVKIRK